jgi:two-component system cell cycle response regulator DivK
VTHIAVWKSRSESVWNVVTLRDSSSQHPIVLLVQREQDDREMYAEFLHHEGLPPICLSSARHALTIAPYADVIITGLLLPGEIVGFELIARLRNDERTRNAPIVVLTACAWTTERERAVIAGCDVFLSKPCLPRDLLHEVRRMLTFSKVRRTTGVSGRVKPLPGTRIARCREAMPTPGRNRRGSVHAPARD